MKKLKATLVAIGSAFTFGAYAQGQALPYPDTSWSQGDPKGLGWSTQKLAELGQYLKTVPEGSLMVIDKGQVVAQWGDVTKRVKLSSVRKSFVSALYGIYVQEGRVDLSKTLAQMGIDDVPPLTAAERQATVRDVLEARSGIYRAFVGGTPAMRATMPARGSHAPGTFWYYNNWDFNVAGAILEQQSGIKLGTAFQDRIAKPLQMQDFRPEDLYYVTGAPGTPAEETSKYPAYQFRMSTRDVARFGYLLLRAGSWTGTNIVPSAWVRESTTSYSDLGAAGGYGYYWWINDWPGIAEPHYSAKGALGKNLVIFPRKEIVVVYLNHTDYPENINSVSESELKNLPNMKPPQMAKLLQLILEASPQQ
ncbi:serine hydrolase domain-containing protein [Variovorax sp. ZT5P49]|uniref:serine hydrolase domain-containing protein n=1 Tax=Variovorax sp. ZT5P49 TaxID=3443733 RepID=UPI003F4723A6